MHLQFTLNANKHLDAQGLLCATECFHFKLKISNQPTIFTYFSLHYTPYNSNAYSLIGSGRKSSTFECAVMYIWKSSEWNKKKRKCEIGMSVKCLKLNCLLVKNSLDGERHFFSKEKSASENRRKENTNWSNWYHKNCCRLPEKIKRMHALCEPAKVMMVLFYFSPLFFIRSEHFKITFTFYLFL